MPRRVDDELLKGVFEDFFPDFLRFFYPSADKVFDLGKGIEFLDKELLAIVPDRKSGSGKRIADLLAKVRCRDGTDKCILVHTEIERGSNKEFGMRMFEYYYRILDHHRRPVEAIAVFTGAQGQVRPPRHTYSGLWTTNDYCYGVYHIFQHREEELLAMDNVFALVVLACQKAMGQGKVSGEELAQSRLAIAKALLGLKIELPLIRKLLVFLKNILYVDNEELNRKFNQEVLLLTDNNLDMGVIEIINKREREKGIEAGIKTGIKTGIKKGRKEEALAIAKRLKAKGGALDEIAEVTGLSLQEIEKL